MVRLTAAPVEGQANAALGRVLAQALDVAPSAVRIVRGASGRDKLVSVAGLSVVGARMRLEAALGAARR